MKSYDKVSRRMEGIFYFILFNSGQNKKHGGGRESEKRNSEDQAVDVSE